MPQQQAHLARLERRGRAHTVAVARPEPHLHRYYACNMSDEASGQRICRNPGCERPVTKRGGQGGERLYCSNSCRTKMTQRRATLAAEQPELVVRLAVERALRHLDADTFESALLMTSQSDQKALRKVQDTLRAALKRLPDFPEKDTNA